MGMKNYVRNIMIVLVLLGVSILSASKPVYAEENGTIEITLEDLQKAGSSRQNVEFELYRVGDIVDEKPMIYTLYDIKKYPQKAQETESVSKLILEKIKSKPIQTGKTDAQGKLTFYGVVPGVYLLTAIHPNDYGNVVPALLHLPYYEVIDDQKSEKLFKVSVNPKASYQDNPLNPDNHPEEPDDNKKPNPKPDDHPNNNNSNNDNHNTNQNPNTSNNGGKPDHTGTSTDKKTDDNVQTGDHSNRNAYLFLMGITATGIYIIYRKRTKKYI